MAGQGVPCDRKGCRTTATTTRRAPPEPGERFPPMLDLCLEHAREFDTLNLPPPPAPKPRRAPPPPPKLVTTPAPDRPVTKPRKFTAAELDAVLELVSQNPGSTSSTLQALSEIPGTAWLLQRALEMDPPRVRAEGSSGKGSRRWFPIPPVLEGIEASVEQLQSPDALIEPDAPLEPPVDGPRGILALANTPALQETALRVGLGLTGEASGATAAAIAKLRAEHQPPDATRSSAVADASAGEPQPVPPAPDEELGDDATEETTAPPDEAATPGATPPPGDPAWTQPDTFASVDGTADALRYRPLLDAPRATPQGEIPPEAWFEVDGVRWATDGVMMVRESFAAHAPTTARPWRVPPFRPDLPSVPGVWRMLMHTDEPHPGVFGHAFAPMLACARAVVADDDEDIDARVRPACLLVDGQVMAVLMPLRFGPGVYADGRLSPIYYNAAEAIKADRAAALKEAAAGEEAARKKMQENGFCTNPGGTRVALDKLLDLYVDHQIRKRSESAASSAPAAGKCGQKAYGLPGGEQTCTLPAGHAAYYHDSGTHLWTDNGRPPACEIPDRGSPAGAWLYAWYNRGGDPATAGLTFNGAPCPSWDDLTDNVRAKWNAAAEAAQEGFPTPDGYRERADEARKVLFESPPPVEPPPWELDAAGTWRRGSVAHVTDELWSVKRPDGSTYGGLEGGEEGKRHADRIIAMDLATQSDVSPELKAQICRALHFDADTPLDIILERIQEFDKVARSLPRDAGTEQLDTRFLKWANAVIPGKASTRQGSEALGAILAHIANGRVGIAMHLLGREVSNGEALLSMADKLEMRAKKVYKIARVIGRTLDGSYRHLVDLGGAL